MRRAARVDANHGAIRGALEAVGWHVFDASRMGHGWPDLLVCRRGQVVFVEVKDGDKVPSAQKLTPAEEKFQARAAAAGVPYRIVRTIHEAVNL